MSTSPRAGARVEASSLLTPPTRGSAGRTTGDDEQSRLTGALQKQETRARTIVVEFGPNGQPRRRDRSRRRRAAVRVEDRLDAEIVGSAGRVL